MPTVPVIFVWRLIWKDVFLNQIAELNIRVGQYKDKDQQITFTYNETVGNLHIP